MVAVHQRNAVSTTLCKEAHRRGTHTTAASRDLQRNGCTVQCAPEPSIIIIIIIPIIIIIKSLSSSWWARYVQDKSWTFVSHKHCKQPALHCTCPEALVNIYQLLNLRVHNMHNVHWACHGVSSASSQNNIICQVLLQAVCAVMQGHNHDSTNDLLLVSYE